MAQRVTRNGQVVKTVRDIVLTNNIHITVLSSAAPVVLRKGTEAEVIAEEPNHIELNCKDGIGHGPAAWGLKIRIDKVMFGQSFE